MQHERAYAAYKVSHLSHRVLEEIVLQTKGPILVFCVWQGLLSQDHMRVGG